MPRAHDVNTVVLSSSFASDRGVAVAVHESGMLVTVAQSLAGPYAGRRLTIRSPA